MKYNTALLFAATAAVAYAQVSSSPDLGDDMAEAEYLENVCLPTNATGYPDLTAPCNAILALQYECTFGTEAGLALVASIFGPNGSPEDTDLPPMQDNSTQRNCVCSSQFFNQVNGCVDCSVKHGDNSSALEPSYISSVSSSYCAATNTPSLGLADFLYSLAGPSMTASGNSSNIVPTTTFSDPIGNKTAVSLYYTGSVTGTAAYLVPTVTGSLITSNGQIVPTASSNNAVAASSGTSTGKSGAQKTQAAIAGVIGLAGFVALL